MNEEDNPIELIPIEEEAGGLKVPCQECGEYWAVYTDIQEDKLRKICPKCVKPTGKLYTLQEALERQKIRKLGQDPDKQKIKIKTEED